jgi:hypothetical protein
VIEISFFESVPKLLKLIFLGKDLFHNYRVHQSLKISLLKLARLILNHRRYHFFSLKNTYFNTGFR